jgi:lipid II:glycine glycyltransferase (peptidoglycan interpeptide bridge formation enzyme)
LGYISRGPVLAYEDAELANFAVDCICQVAKQLRLKALIVQPVEASEPLFKAFKTREFLSNYVANLTTATLIVDASQEMDVVEKAMSRTMRQKVRQAKQRGVIIRNGGEEDIARFFQLMLSTCERQNTKPNPPDENSLRSLWNAFYPFGGMRLSFAEHDGETLAGLVSIPFGNRVTFWKRGWNERGGNLHPNELLMFEAILWSHENGFKICDFGSMNPGIAKSLLLGKPLSESQKKEKDFFHLGFGGKPVLIPEGFVLAIHPLFKLSYRWARWAFSFPNVSNFVRRHLQQ